MMSFASGLLRESVEIKGSKYLNINFPSADPVGTVFVTLLFLAFAERASCKVHKLLCTGWLPTTLIFIVLMALVVVVVLVVLAFTSRSTWEELFIGTRSPNKQFLLSLNSWPILDRWDACNRWDAWDACMLHSGHALWRKVRSSGGATEYRTNQETRQYIPILIVITNVDEASESWCTVPG